MDSPHPKPAAPPPELRARTVFRNPPTTGSASPTVSAAPPGGSAASSGGVSQRSLSSPQQLDHEIIWRRAAGPRSSPERVSLRRGLAAVPSPAGDSGTSATSSGGAFRSSPSATRPPEREVIWKRVAEARASSGGDSSPERVSLRRRLTAAPSAAGVAAPSDNAPDIRIFDQPDSGSAASAPQLGGLVSRDLFQAPRQTVGAGSTVTDPLVLTSPAVSPQQHGRNTSDWMFTEEELRYFGITVATPRLADGTLKEDPLGIVLSQDFSDASPDAL